MNRTLYDSTHYNECMLHGVHLDYLNLAPQLFPSFFVCISGTTYGTVPPTNSLHKLYLLFLPKLFTLPYTTHTLNNEGDNEQKEIELKYIVTDAGLLSSEIVPSFHFGTVVFIIAIISV